MIYNSTTIKKYFDELHGSELSVMNSLNIVYISNGWHLEITGKPLIDEKIEAWSTTAVIVELYENITNNKKIKIVNLDNKTKKFLDEVYKIHKQRIENNDLISLVKVVDGAWFETIVKKGRFGFINYNDIKREYQNKRIK